MDSVVLVTFLPVTSITMLIHTLDYSARTKIDDVAKAHDCAVFGIKNDFSFPQQYLKISQHLRISWQVIESKVSDLQRDKLDIVYISLHAAHLGHDIGLIKQLQSGESKRFHIMPPTNPMKRDKGFLRL
jgi:hypothetical protein